IIAAPTLLGWLTGRRTPLFKSAAAAVVVVPLLAFWVVNGALHRLLPSLRRSAVVDQAVGDWARGHTSPADTLFVWGSSPEIYHFSQRAAGTRFVFCNYQTGKIWATDADVDYRDDPRQVVEATWPMLLD